MAKPINRPGSLIVTSEVLTEFVRHYRRAERAVWLSVDNYYNNTKSWKIRTLLALRRFTPATD